MAAAIYRAKLHPSGRINPFGLDAGDVLVWMGNRYEVTKGFDSDPSACWTQSRWVRCKQLTGHPAQVGQITYVKPHEARLACDEDTEGAIWLQRDAAYLYREAARYRDGPRDLDPWMATKVQANAAHSSRAARRLQGIE